MAELVSILMSAPSIKNSALETVSTNQDLTNALAPRFENNKGLNITALRLGHYGMICTRPYYQTRSKET